MILPSFKACSLKITFVFSNLPSIERHLLVSHFVSCSAAGKRKTTVIGSLGNGQCHIKPQSGPQEERATKVSRPPVNHIAAKFFTDDYKFSLFWIDWYLCLHSPCRGRRLQRYFVMEAELLILVERPSASDIQ